MSGETKGTNGRGEEREGGALREHTQCTDTTYTVFRLKIHLKIKKNGIYQVQVTHIIMFLFVKG